MSVILVLGIFITNRVANNGIRKAYLEGYTAGQKSVTLEDVCVDLEPAGISRDYEHGIGFDWVRCKTNFHEARVENDFFFEGDWDRCDDEGNCEPFVRDSEIINQPTKEI